MVSDAPRISLKTFLFETVFLMADHGTQFPQSSFIFVENNHNFFPRGSLRIEEPLNNQTSVEEKRNFTIDFIFGLFVGG